MISDPGVILAALGLPAVVASTAMAGFEASVWRAELVDGRVVAVRALRPGLASGWELDALTLAAERTAVSPRLIAEGRVEGQATIVSTWRPGRPIGDLLAEGGDPHALGAVFGAAQAQLHVPVDGSSLCHGDYQPFNVLVTDGAVTGIVDWSMGGLDDPRTDLAWTRVVLALGPAVFPHLEPALDEFVEGWRHGYARLLPRPDDDYLGGALRVAAERQAREWRTRAEAGECPPGIADVAAEILNRWS